MQHYVYKFLNSNNEVIYIGKTESIKKRLTQQHFTRNGHLDDWAYYETEKVFVAELISHEEMDIYERYLINIHSPRYNKMMNNSNTFRFTLPELEWEEVPIDMNKDQFLKRIMNKMFESSAIISEEIQQMSDGEACIRDNANQVNEYGYRTVTRNDAPILSLKLRRNPGYRSSKFKQVERHPYCRYIVVDDKIYYCIDDIEGVIHDNLNTSAQTRILIDKEIIKPQEIMVLKDETLKKNLHVGSGTTLRFGSDEWLAKRVLRQIDLNKRCKPSEKHHKGWTEELEFLAKLAIKSKENKMNLIVQTITHAA